MQSILIVDDHIGLREAYEILFMKEGYNVQLAKDGEEAVQLVATKQFDLILLDMLMPNMSGLEFLRIFKPTDHPETKVGVFSNLQAEEQVKEAMELGATRFLSKATLPPREMAAIVLPILG